MSRVIKFRVWDIKRKRLVYPKELSVSPDLIKWGNGGSPRRCDPDHCVLEQFTGLQDSQGREIYEGDIVRWVHGPTDIGVVEYRAHDEFGSYPSAAFFGLLVSRFAGLCQFQSDDEYEVIDNIHEHPDLLNPSQK